MGSDGVGNVTRPIVAETVLHLSDEEIAGFLEGDLTHEEQMRVDRHIAACQACARDVADTAAILAGVGLLAPPKLFHPLEHLLERLNRRVPLSVLGWHILLETLTYLLLTVTLGWAGPPLPWHSTHGKTLWTGLILLVLTTHFLWLQPRLRTLIRDLWRAGASPASLEHLNRRLAWLQGWPLGGLWLFAAMYLPNNALNLLSSRPVTWEYAKETLITLYEGFPFVAMLWGASWGGFFWRAIVVSTHAQPEMRVIAILERARKLALAWVALGSVGATAFLFVNIRTAVPAALLWWWVSALVTILLLLWAGYVHLDYRLSRRGDQAARLTGALALRFLLTLTLALTPFLALVPLHID